jgi:hypothetical protein
MENPKKFAIFEKVIACTYYFLGIAYYVIKFM